MPRRPEPRLDGSALPVGAHRVAATRLSRSRDQAPDCPFPRLGHRRCLHEDARVLPSLAISEPAALAAGE